MKIFISYSRSDKEFAEKLASALKRHGITPWVDTSSIKVGENILQKTRSSFQSSDGAIIILSAASVRSQWVNYEMSSFLAREARQQKTLIYPVLIEDAEIPVALRDRLYADFRGAFDVGLEQLLQAIKPKKPRKRSAQKSTSLEKDNKESSFEFQIGQIKTDYDAGNLVLICGAGVSIGAGLPSWPVLLQSLLSELFSEKGTDGRQKIMAELFQESFRPSPLMVAQYLKNGLGRDFLPRLREVLYRNNAGRSDIIDAIIEMCRPQRSRASLHSIVTFNFDDLVERSLETSSIKYRSIFKEGQRCKSTELPVYHVHGFIPMSGKLTEDHQVVFSEDAYHSQFIDAFSWANLIQLNHLGQNRCLFVGLSLTDPNLRRLLDVSSRKNPDRTRYHYIFRKRYDASDIAHSVPSSTSKSDKEAVNALVKIVESLEEQDANNLGLNVIWIDQFGEIPSILQRIAAI